MKKKIISKFCLALMLFSCCYFSSPLYAQEDVDLSKNLIEKIIDESPIITEEEFIKGQEDGWIDKDLNYTEFRASEEKAREIFSSNLNAIAQVENFSDFNEFENCSLMGVTAYVKEFYPGDIFYMNSNASGGFTGHLVMALSNREFVSINGYGTPLKIFDRNSFKSQYQGRDILLYRSNDYNWGAKAAQWASNTYRNRTHLFKYQINGDITDIYNTYCSKIVYQSYLYGVGRIAFYDSVDPRTPIHPMLIDSLIKVGLHGQVNGYAISN